MSFLGKVKQQSTELKNQEWLVAARQARRVLADLAPSARLRFSQKLRDTIVAEFRQCISIDDCIAFGRRYTKHGSIQIPWEIESAIKFIAATRPKVMCEIGTFDGGTSLLFSKFLNSVAMMIHVDLYVKNKGLLRLIAPQERELHFLDMSSHSDRTLKKIANVLNGRMIDTLFIDGDHHYEGVKNDFWQYRSFVRDGGLIVFHDIVSDKGVSSAWTGGVPKLWKELSQRYPHQEFIQNKDQDGFGIGILEYSRNTEPERSRS